MPRPRQYDEKLRNALIERCSQIISTKGADSLSLRTLASDVGTTTAAVYSLFGSRDALLQAVVTEGFARFGARLAALTTTHDPGADLLALGMAYRSSALTDPHFYRVMFGAASGAPAKTADADYSPFHALQEAVARVARQNPERGAHRLWALAHGLVSLELAGLLPGDDTERERSYRRALELAGPVLVQP